MDRDTRYTVYDMEEFLSSVERQWELYEKTEDSSIEGDLGPVTKPLARYNLEPLDHFLESWGELHESYKEEAREHRNDLENGKPDLVEEYRALEERIKDDQEAIEELYELDNLFGLKARYTAL